MDNFAATLDHAADRRPDKVVLTAGRHHPDQRRAAAAGATRSLPAWPAEGVGRGDVVAMLLPNGVEFLELVYAVNRIGAAFLPLNTRLAPAEWEYILGHSEAVAIVADAEFLPQLADVLPAAAGPAHPGRRRRRTRPPRAGPGTRSFVGCARRRRRPGRRRAGVGPAAAHVHLGHDVAAQGRVHQPREPAGQEPRDDHRVRADRAGRHRRRRAALPRGRPRHGRPGDPARRRQPGGPAALRRRRSSSASWSGTGRRRSGSPRPWSTPCCSRSSSRRPTSARCG